MSNISIGSLNSTGNEGDQIQENVQNQKTQTQQNQEIPHQLPYLQNPFQNLPFLPAVNPNMLFSMPFMNFSIHPQLHSNQDKILEFIKTFSRPM